MKRYRHYKKDKAIVLSCFGSVVEQKRYLDLQKLIESEFEGVDVFLSFSSRMVLKVLKKEGLKYKNLPQTLADIDRLGYRNVIVSSINLFPTDEHEMLKKIVSGFDSFSPANFRYTDAILTKTKDTTLFFRVLNQSVSKSGMSNLYIIHGTPALELGGMQSITYSANLLEMIDKNNFSCSLEGAFPYFAIKERLIQKMKNHGVRDLQIVPLLLISGNHYQKDMFEINDELSKYFNCSITPPLGSSERFNLIELNLTTNIIIKNIREEIIKLG